MKAETAADRSAMVETDDWGIAVLWKGTTRLTGIYETPYLADLEDAEAAIGTADPSFIFPSADAPGIAEGDTILIFAADLADLGVSPAVDTGYKVAGPPQPDGSGFTSVQLSKV